MKFSFLLFVGALVLHSSAYALSVSADCKTYKENAKYDYAAAANFFALAEEAVSENKGIDVLNENLEYAGKALNWAAGHASMYQAFCKDKLDGGARENPKP